MKGLADTLIRAGAVREDVLRDVIAEVGEGAELPRRLLADKVVAPLQLAQVLATQTGYGFVDLASIELHPATVGLLDPALSRRHRLIALERGRRSLTIGMVDPSDGVALDDVAAATALNVRPVVVAADALESAFARLLPSLAATDVAGEESGASAAAPSAGTRAERTLAIADAAAADSAGTAGSGAADTARAASSAGRARGTAGAVPLVAADDDAFIRGFVTSVILQAISDRASDIHIDPGEEHLSVRYRIDGVLHDRQRVDRALLDGVIARLETIATTRPSDRRRSPDAHLTVRHEGREVRLRLTTLPTVWGEKAVMRILDDRTSTPTLAELNFSLFNEKRFHEAITRPHGMVLVTGPTGSGASTTLYAALTTVANARINVVTVEDPVEYRMSGVNQVQVEPRAGLTFPSALRSALRSDPDVVLVGEIRDEETAMISIEAALTGHLVLSTLNANDAPSALTRLTELGCEPFLVGTALSAVVAQRLARRLCLACREAYRESREVLDSIRFPYSPGDPPALYRAVGCAECAGTGYRGRVALHEVMTVSESLERMVIARATGAEMRAVTLHEGMVSLRDDGFSKAQQGITTIEEVLRVSA